MFELKENERILIVAKTKNTSLPGGRKDTLMKKDNVVSLRDRVEDLTGTRDVLEEIIREGARRMLQSALEAEVTEYIDRNKGLVDDQGHRAIVRNGHLPERDLITGAGPVRIKQPRVRNKGEGHRFTSKILPPFLRRVPSVDALIPILYLKGVSSGDFTEALEAILGPNAVGLSATNIVRLKEGWKKDYDRWAKRSLKNKRLCVLVGGWDLFQRSIGEGSTLYVGADGSAGRWKKGAYCSLGWREGEQGLLVGSFT